MITLSTSSREFVSKWFLVRKLHINHLTQSDDMIYRLLLPWAFSDSVHLHTIYGSWDSKERCQMLAATNQTHGMKLKINQVLFLCKLRWLITLSTSFHEFVSKRFPDRKLHINHLAQSDDMIYQLLLPLAFTDLVSSSYHTWK